MYALPIKPLASNLKRESAWYLKSLRHFTWKRNPAHAATTGPWHVVSEVRQLIPGNSLAKRVNLQMALNKLGKLELAPQGTFSFWIVVGRPSLRAGFVESRSIISGKLVSSPGGGLCQLAGMLFQLGLLSGLRVQERHSHSIDIYREEERHAPLGLDAAVAFPLKDLVLRNSTSHSFRIELAIGKDELIGRVLSTAEIAPRTVQISRWDEKDRRLAITRIFDGEKLETEIRSEYQIGVTE